MRFFAKSERIRPNCHNYQIHSLLGKKRIANFNHFLTMSHKVHDHCTIGSVTYIIYIFLLLLIYFILKAIEKLTRESLN
jgi:hypothetical protein